MKVDLLRIVYDSGHAIPGARSASQLEKAVTPLLQLEHFDDDPRWPASVVERWQHQFDTDTFLIGQAREVAISVGTAALLCADYDPDTVPAGTDPLVESVRSFKSGLIAGGMGQSITKALISREISNSTVASFRGTSYAAFRNANALSELTHELQLSTWRDSASVGVARLGHRLRFGMSQRAIQKLVKRAATDSDVVIAEGTEQSF